MSTGAENLLFPQTDGGPPGPTAPQVAAPDPDAFTPGSVAAVRAFYIERRYSVSAPNVAVSDQPLHYAVSAADARTLLAYPLVVAFCRSAAVDLAYEGSGPDAIDSLYSGAWVHLERKLTRGLAYEHRSDRAFKCWLYMVCVNAVRDGRLDDTRGRRGDSDVLAAVRAGVAAPNGHTIMADTGHSGSEAFDYTVWGAVLDIIRTLPADQQQAVLRETRGESGREVAARLGVSEPRVSQLKDLAVQKIRDSLRDLGFDVPPARKK